MREQESDADLVRAALRSEAEAFGALMARYRDAVFGVAFHRLGRFEEARDAAQEAFIKAYLNLSSLREPEAFGTWLYRIADGTAVDFARRPQREAPLPEESLPAPAASEAERTAQADLAAQVRHALAGLSEPSRLAVILHYINGYSQAEVAQFIGATPQAVKMRLSRARSQLREEMAEMVRERLSEAAAPAPKMHRYAFEAHQDAGGALLTGVSEATSAAELRRRLEDRGYTATTIRRETRKERQKWEEERQKREQAPDDRDPIVRIAAVIQEQAVKDQADVVRIKLTAKPPRVRATAMGAAAPTQPEGPHMEVRYRIRGRWHQVMVTPYYVWPPLRQHFEEHAEELTVLKRTRNEFTFAVG